MILPRGRTKPSKPAFDAAERGKILESIRKVFFFLQHHTFSGKGAMQAYNCSRKATIIYGITISNFPHNCIPR
jgi:hypothetical protein